MLTRQQIDDIDNSVIHALKTVYDPEIPINIYEMGLIYRVKISNSGKVTIRMTLTSPNCPEAQSIPEDVKSKVQYINGVTGVDVDIVWDPPWSMDMMSDAAKLELGMF